MSKLNSNLRTEAYKQNSGEIKFSLISNVKQRHYYVEDINLDGDAPKEYIRAYFYYKNCPKINSPSKWDGYIAKFGSKSYPHESIIEFLINKIGDSLGLKMNECRLVVINQQVRFLSKDFIKRGKNRLIHGTEILSEYFEDRDFIEKINNNRNVRREILTFDVVQEALMHVYPDYYDELILELVRLVCFDAIVGNNDRHFFNWGVIGDVKKNSIKDKVLFSPIYDSARGLFWNITDENLIEIYHDFQKNGKKIDAYIKSSKPRFSYPDNPNANHFEFLEYLINLDSEFRHAIIDLTSPKKEMSVLRTIDEILLNLVIAPRIALCKEVIVRRFETIRKLL